MHSILHCCLHNILPHEVHAEVQPAELVEQFGYKIDCERSHLDQLLQLHPWCHSELQLTLVEGHHNITARGL